MPAMKTLTQFSGGEVRGALDAKARLTAEGVPPESLTERLGEAVGMKDERLQRLVGALEAVADRAPRVRLVRVFAAEEAPKGAVKIGELNYLIDLQPEAARPGGRD